MILTLLFALIVAIPHVTTDTHEALEDYIKDPRPANKCASRFLQLLESLGYRWDKETVCVQPEENTVKRHLLKEKQH